MKGYIHSIETCGTVDGPGIRYVVFTQGCPLRCRYCHNPDTWKMLDGKEVTVDEIIQDAVKYKPYMKFSGGGLTLTGGEPTLQIEFATELFKRCKEEDIHTALDTSGYVDIEKADKLLKYTDLVLLDIKHIDSNTHKDITGVPNDKTLRFARHLSDIDIPTWIRYVLVPGLTDKQEDIEKLAVFVSTLSSVERVEILPYHTMGVNKWKELGYEYTLKDVNPPSKEAIARAINIFKKHLKITQKVVA
ncbi:pyruvate formate-lyase-activating protein [Caldanaerobius polysaccharolyticus]|uniref:pyruvate formate-lyase-activating protein n=1 Tax=Caldanaerobius polysaccharolyticus TaxID=44256 RepID=UPI000479F98F|nr:pyruvate formate-lyase-activating protein [Caldanaerobius polysaccharolyticus]